jgi:hypothetical protein
LVRVRRGGGAFRKPLQQCRGFFVLCHFEPWFKSAAAEELLKKTIRNDGLFFGLNFFGPWFESAAAEELLESHSRN